MKVVKAATSAGASDGDLAKYLVVLMANLMANLMDAGLVYLSVAVMVLSLGISSVHLMVAMKVGMARLSVVTKVVRKADMMAALRVHLVSM